MWKIRLESFNMILHEFDIKLKIIIVIKWQSFVLFPPSNFLLICEKGQLNQ